MSRTYFADADLWCENGHDPKLPDEVDGTLVCRYCGREYEVSVDVEVTDPSDTGTEQSGGQP